MMHVLPNVAKWLCVATLSLSMAMVRLTGAQIEPPRLDIRPQPGVEPSAARVALLDREALLRIMQLAGVDRPGAPIVVILAAEGSDPARATPYWIAGFASGASSTVVLFPSRSPTYPHDSLEDVLLHEIAHVLITRAAGGGFVPRWFHEGLALAAERRSTLRDRTELLLAVAIERRPLGELDAALAAGHGDASRAYALAGAVVRDILRRNGPETAARVLAAVAAGATFDEGVRMVTGRTLGEVEREFWRDSWWQQVIPFLTSSAVLWFGVILLAAYARRARAVRRATLRQQWEDEERRHQEAEALLHTTQGEQESGTSVPPWNAASDFPSIGEEPPGKPRVH